MDPASSSPAQFQTTRWSLIVRARGEGALAHAAMEALCRAYWFPLYAFARRNGVSRPDAEDLTQAFFSHVLASDFVARAEPEKGRFRSFLLASLRNFMAKENARESAQKRGGGVRPVDFDENAAEERLGLTAARAELTPAQHFERDWALALLEQALDRLGAEQRAMGRAELFERLRPLLRSGPQRGDYEALAAEFGIAKGTLTVTMHRLQQRYRELVRAEILQTVASPDDLDDELRHLLSILQA
ncbi:MAG: sigma-70 family RNA polymerase sigma factor [Verrucomicrobia bacterium]|nr:sigma-70 family RNA polymerase sigma factor [Verrucomicrobiota bacterium]